MLLYSIYIHIFKLQGIKKTKIEIHMERTRKESVLF